MEGTQGDAAGTSKVLVISGSTRPTRIGLEVTQWVLAHLPHPAGLDLELLDLRDWSLPFDEPSIPALGKYQHDHTRAWSAKIAGANGFVFVTPQYNWGYPAALKNALDHLFHEWVGKPAMIVSYGFQGGGKSAAQLRQVLDGLRMRTAPTMPALVLPPEMRAEGTPFETALPSFAAALPDLEQAFAEFQGLLAEAK
jgi:NAD(P)H-dependent FMN reductase